VRGAVQAIIDRLQLELKVIEKTGFLSYFLIVGDFIRFGHDKGIRLRGPRLCRRLDCHVSSGNF